MDPDAALATTLGLVADILIANQLGNPVDPAALELAEAVQNLNRWIRDGGFLPTAWNT